MEKMQNQEKNKKLLIKENLPKLPYLFAKQQLVLPVDEKEGKIILAIVDPLNLDGIAEAKMILGKEAEKEIDVVVYDKAALEEAIEACYLQKEEEKQKLFSEFSQKTKNLSLEENVEEYDLLDRKQEHPAVRILNAILIEAIQQKASDIHFEPQESSLNIRYRIDGILLNRPSPPLEYQSQILTRIKVLAKLDIAEHRLPQDGRIKLRMGGREIDFRVSTIPVVYGERIVLRILDKGSIVLGLDHIGMNTALLESFRRLIKLPEGIILVTGPTGSGKTTTLYSAISEIHSSEMNIMTIEDPVEYKIPSIAQIGVNPKISLDFAKGLRHILRQDPDVILIGEIRDRETAEIAIQAALTGHLVFSTLHTNDAVSALARLGEMNIESYLLSSSVVGVLAQRLVRKICPHCKVSYVPEAQELKELQVEKKQLNQGRLWKGQGCGACFGTGYKGRQGIYELCLVTPMIKKQIIKSLDSAALREVALSQGMRELYQDGLSLLLQGITSSAELLRVTRISLEDQGE